MLAVSHLGINNRRIMNTKPMVVISNITDGETRVRNINYNNYIGWEFVTGLDYLD